MNEWSYPQAFAPQPPVPMTFGQILDRTYRLMRANLSLFLGIATVPTAIIVAFIAGWTIFVLKTIGPLMNGTSPQLVAVPLGAPFLFSFFLICYPIMLAAYALYLPAAFFAAANADRGLAVTFRQAYSVAWSRFGRSLWLMVLLILYMVVPIAVVGALIASGAALIHHATGAGFGPPAMFFLVPLIVLLYLGILVYSVLIMLRFALAYPACIEEDLSAWKALQRSASLTRDAKGRIFLVLLVVYAIVYAMELVCILVLVALAAVAAFIAVSAHVTMGSPTFFILAGVGVFAYMLIIGACILLSYAAFTTALAVLYHDQRLRKDIPMSAQSPA
jgi:hypothetical protein